MNRVLLAAVLALLPVTTIAQSEGTLGVITEELLDEFKSTQKLISSHCRRT